MTVPASTVPAVRTQLVSLYTAAMAAVDPYTLQVSDGAPGRFTPDDLIMVGDVSGTFEGMAIVGSGGAGWLREEYDVRVEVEVFRPGDDAPTTWGRCTDLAYTAQQQVRDDPTLGGLVIQAVPARIQFRDGWDTKRGGRFVEALFDIHCTAQL